MTRWLSLITVAATAGVPACRRAPEVDRAPVPIHSEVTPPSASASASASAPPVAAAAAAAPVCPLRRWLSGHDFAPDGRRLATSCDSQDCAEDPADTAIDVWDLAAGGVARTLQVASATIDASWAGDGLLVAVSAPGTGVRDITVWETRGFRVLHAEPHYCAYPHFDPASRRMLITGCDGAMQLIDVASRRRIVRPAAEAHLGGDYSVGGWFSRDGRRVYVQDERYGLQALDPATLRRRAVVASTGQDASVDGARVAVAEQAPESDRFALLEASGAVRLLLGDLSVAATLLPAPAASPATRLAWIDERRVALFHEDGGIAVLEVASHAERLALPPAPPSTAKCVSSLTVSPKRGWIAFRRTDCEVELLDAALTRQWSIPASPRLLAVPPGTDVAPILAFSPDDRHLAALFDDRSLVVYDAASGQKKAAVKVPPGLDRVSKDGGSYRPLVPGWSPDGRFVVLAQGEILLMRPTDGAFVVLSMFEEGGKRLPVVSSDTAFDGPPALEPCAFPAPARAPRRAQAGLLAGFFAAR